MTEKRKIYKVQIWLKSQDKPIEYETSWYYIDEADLNNPNPAFLKLEDNYLRKDDILKILLIGVREVDESEANAIDNSMPF